jgi:hypothetical protein
MSDPYGGYAQGSADLVNAQSSLLREQAKTVEIENRRRTFDEWLYERAHTPTANEAREGTTREEVRRSRNDAPLPEIWSAKALNDLLASAQKLRGRNIQGPKIALDEDLLKKINVTPRKDGGNFGILRNDGKLTWPLALRGLDDSRALRADLEALVTKVYNEAKEGRRVDPNSIQKIDDYSTQLHNMLVKNVGTVPFDQYREAKAYLRQLDDALRVLKRGDAAEFINGSFAPQANTVAELVDFMSSKGLHFAPATGNDQDAYLALHRALVDYDVGANTHR